MKAEEIIYSALDALREYLKNNSTEVGFDRDLTLKEDLTRSRTGKTQAGRRQPLFTLLPRS